MKTKTSFHSLYSFPGFRARSRFKSGVFQDPKARVVELVRRQKKQSVQYAAHRHEFITINGFTESGMWMPAACASIWNSSTGGFIAGRVEA
jgi:hypothetical protein